MEYAKYKDPHNNTPNKQMNTMDVINHTSSTGGIVVVVVVVPFTVPLLSTCLSVPHFINLRYAPCSFITHWFIGILTVELIIVPSQLSLS